MEPGEPPFDKSRWTSVAPGKSSRTASVLPLPSITIVSEKFPSDVSDIAEIPSSLVHKVRRNVSGNQTKQSGKERTQRTPIAAASSQVDAIGASNTQFSKRSATMGGEQQAKSAKSAQAPPEVSTIIESSCSPNASHHPNVQQTDGKLAPNIRELSTFRDPARVPEGSALTGSKKRRRNMQSEVEVPPRMLRRVKPGGRADRRRNMMQRRPPPLEEQPKRHSVPYFQHDELDPVKYNHGTVHVSHPENITYRVSLTKRFQPSLRPNSARTTSNLCHTTAKRT